MNIALCYESVLPARGGCETYIADLARRLVADGHQVHLFANQWDAELLPEELHYHRLPASHGPRFWKPWQFGSRCLAALRQLGPHVSIGFNKTWGQDVQYPLAGLHVASAEHNIYKHRHPLIRGLARAIKSLDLPHWSFTFLERRQYVTHQPLVVVNSGMVRRHFQTYYGIEPDDVRVVRSAIDPDRFAQSDRLRRRLEWRQNWDLRPDDTAALFVAMNYRLKGLDPLLHAMARLQSRKRLRLLVVGHGRNGRWKRLARRLDIADRVRFLGPRSDVHHCFFASDFLVHPTFYDPCSLVVLEALACGLPVITSRFNGAAELLTGSGPNRDEGYVIDDPHDHQELAASIGGLLDPARRSSCAQAARRTSGHWNFELHYRELLAVLEEAALRKHAA